MHVEPVTGSSRSEMGWLFPAVDFENRLEGLEPGLLRVIHVEKQLRQDKGL